MVTARVSSKTAGRGHKGQGPLRRHFLSDSKATQMPLAPHLTRFNNIFAKPWESSTRRLMGFEGGEIVTAEAHCLLRVS